MHDVKRMTPRAIFRQLLEGYLKALEYQHNNPMQAAQRILPRLGLSRGQVLSALDGLYQPDMSENRALLIGNQRQALIDSLQRLIHLMQGQDLLHRTPGTSNLLSGHWLPEG